ncbi:MAG: protocatechuate 3,4-dioxygenase subunit beta [Opitutales bacterium]|jgi:protocatechuate 3,4-dioxygenase beta subunit|nr:protocatechuate 3,4-dioxygenase subunit beta [Opitutales bacterium]
MESFTPKDSDSHPPLIHPPYKSSITRSPTEEPIIVPQTITELTGPKFNPSMLPEDSYDLTNNSRNSGEPIGERLIVAGRVLDENGVPISGVMVEIWQANSAGKYTDREDQHHAAVDPNFLGAGRTITDEDGWYRFITIRPGAYPWGNHANAWRPHHIHFSILGKNIMTRLVTQMYFEGDPLLPFDPIYNAAPDDARTRLIAAFSLDLTEQGFALGYRWDIVIRGPKATPFED